MSVEQAVLAALIAVTLLMLRAQVGIGRQRAAWVRFVGSGLPRLLLVMGLVLAIRWRTELSVSGWFLVVCASIAVWNAASRLFPSGIRIQSLPPDLRAALRPVPVLVLIGSCTSSMTAAVVGLAVWAPLIRSHLASLPGSEPPDWTAGQGLEPDDSATVSWRHILAAVALAGITMNSASLWPAVLLMADAPMETGHSMTIDPPAGSPSVRDGVRRDVSAIGSLEPWRPYETGHLVVLCLLILAVSLSGRFTGASRGAWTADNGSQDVEP